MVDDGTGIGAADAVSGVSVADGIGRVGSLTADPSVTPAFNADWFREIEAVTRGGRWLGVGTLSGDSCSNDSAAPADLSSIGTDETPLDLTEGPPLRE
jgi:hypothetical protein